MGGGYRGLCCWRGKSVRGGDLDVPCCLRGRGLSGVRGVGVAEGSGQGNGLGFGHGMGIWWIEGSLHILGSSNPIAMAGADLVMGAIGFTGKGFRLGEEEKEGERFSFFDGIWNLAG